MVKFNWTKLGEDLLEIPFSIFLGLLAVIGFTWLLSLFGLIWAVMLFAEGYNTIAWVIIIIDIIILLYVIKERYFTNDIK